MKVTQEKVRLWWENNPMTYDWRRTQTYKEMSREFFEEIDKRLFSTSWFAQEKDKKPFSNLIDYDALRDKDVLEVGCGSGAHARLLAESGCRFTGIDLTSKGVALTRRRLELWGLSGNVLKADAEQLQFADESFDYIWSWGVIHHCENPEKALAEICRVLRPGGRIALMVYNRASLIYWVNLLLVRGLVMGKLLSMSMEDICNEYSDGAIARYYKPNEMNSSLSKVCQDAETRIFGQMAELLPLPRYIRNPIVNLMPLGLRKSILTRWGSFLFVTGRKPCAGSRAL